MTLANLDLSKKYTYADYLGWAFDQTIELIRGRIRQMAAPLSNHQDSALNFANLLKNRLKGSPCKVYIAPFDVRLPKPKSHRRSDSDIETVVQPDICVVCDVSKIDRRGCLGAPDMVVEVLSKGTEERDYREKFEVYEESGVREYWIVSVENRSVLVYRLNTEGDRFVADHRPYVAGDRVPVGVIEDFSIQIDDIFEGLLDFD